MISTLRGVAILVGIALLLGLLLVLGDPRRPPRPDAHQIVRTTADQIHAIQWTTPGRPPIKITREGERWRWATPFVGDANPGTVANLLSTLRAARWHRSDDSADHLEVDSLPSLMMLGTGDTVLGVLYLGPPLEGTEQTWLRDGRHGLLVDSWVARALFPSELDLMIVTPFEGASTAPSIEIGGDGGVRLEGQPRRLVRPAQLLVAQQLVAELERAIAGLTIEQLAPTGAATPTLTIDLGTTRGTLAGPCGANDVFERLDTPTGVGCVKRAAADAVRTAVDALRGPPETVLEPRPAPIDVATVTLVDGTILDVTKAPRIGDAAADPVRTTELLAVLAAPAEVVPLRAIEAVPSPRRITVTDRQGATIVLELGTSQSLRRVGEPRALRITPEAWAVLTRTASDLRDASLWSEEPTTITTIGIDGITYQRGAVIGEWTRTPAGAVDAKALERLAAELAAPNVIADAGAFKTLHTIKLVITPPTGRATEHVLELGAPRAQGCPVRAGASVLLPRAVCEHATTLAR